MLPIPYRLEYCRDGKCAPERKQNSHIFCVRYCVLAIIYGTISLNAGILYTSLGTMFAFSFGSCSEQQSYHASDFVFFLLANLSITVKLPTLNVQWALWSSFWVNWDIIQPDSNRSRLACFLVQFKTKWVEFLILWGSPLSLFFPVCEIGSTVIRLQEKPFV